MAATGFTPISLYYSATASAVPLAANLTAGELALNTNDGKLYYKNSSNVVTLLAGATAGPAGGANTQVQYNSSGALVGSANLTFNGTTLTAAGLAGPFNGTVGATTASTGAFTTLSASSTVSGTGFSTYLASPPAIGGTAAAAGAFTTLSASSTVSGTGFSTYLASPPAIGGTAAAAGTFTALTYNTTFTGGTGIVNLGSGQFYKDASGNVGVGTTSPSKKVEVFASANSLQIESVVRNDQSGTGVAAIGFNVSASAASETTSTKAGIGLVRTSSYGVGPLAFYVNSTTSAGDFTTADERVRIDTGGNLLLGTTTSPAGSKELVLGGDYIEGVVAIGSSGTAKTIALTNGTVQTVTLTGNCTFTMPTAVAGKSFTVILSTGAGSFTATFTSVKWPANTAPTITTTASRWDILSFISDGTNWYGNYAQAYA